MTTIFYLCRSESLFQVWNVLIFFQNRIISRLDFLHPTCPITNLIKISEQKTQLHNKLTIHATEEYCFGPRIRHMESCSHQLEPCWYKDRSQTNEEESFVEAFRCSKNAPEKTIEKNHTPFSLLPYHHSHKHTNVVHRWMILLFSLMYKRKISLSLIIRKPDVRTLKSWTIEIKNEAKKKTKKHPQDLSCYINQKSAGGSGYTNLFWKIF